MRLSSQILAVVTAVGLAAAIGSAQQPPNAPAPKAAPKGKQYTLKGKVTDVGKDKVTVNHPAVPGYMPAMEMPYQVDKIDILKSVKVGDQIEATVYDEDYTLYNLKVVSTAAKGK